GNLPKLKDSGSSWPMRMSNRRKREQRTDDGKVCIGRIGLSAAIQEEEIQEGSDDRDHQQTSKFLLFCNTFLTEDLAPIIYEANEHVSKSGTEANEQERPLVMI